MSESLGGILNYFSFLGTHARHIKKTDIQDAQQHECGRFDPALLASRDRCYTKKPVLVPLPLSGQQPYSSQRIFLSIVGDNTLVRHVTEDNNAKEARAKVMLKDACRKWTSGYFPPSKV